MTPPGKTKVVFVGGGHAHLHSLKHADRFAEMGAEVVVVAPHRFHYYSGMGPGLLSRIYRPEEVRVDVENLARARGCTVVKDSVVAVDAHGRTLALAGGQTLAYDIVSFNTGSRVPVERIPGGEDGAIPVKPIENMERVRQAVLQKTHGDAVRVLIVGAGPAGVELAGNLWRVGRENGIDLAVTLSEAGGRILPGFPDKAARIALGSLEGRGIRVVTGYRTASLEGRTARSDSGDEIPHDVAVLTIGIVPHPLYAESGLPAGPDGGLRVNDYLHCVDHPEIFGGGDCVSVEGKRLARVGVYAVRQAPVLFANLMASLGRGALQPFRPQSRYLLILNLGDGSGLVVWGQWVTKGRWAFRWKNHLDTSFMTKYQLSGETRGRNDRAIP